MLAVSALCTGIFELLEILFPNFSPASAFSTLKEKMHLENFKEFWDRRLAF
jgi:hypothetical protein